MTPLSLHRVSRRRGALLPAFCLLTGACLSGSAAAQMPASPAPAPTAPAPAAPAPTAPASGSAAPLPGLQPAPRDTTPRTFTLEEAIAYAQENNPRIGVVAAQIRQARGRVTQRRAERGPQFGVNNFVFRQGPVIPSGIPGAPPAFPPYRWNYGVFVNQVLFDWGQRAARQSGEERRVEAARLRTEETRNDVRLVVSAAFFNVLRAEQILVVATERREAAAEQLRVARARFASDVAPRFDVLRSEAELANAEQDVIDAQNEVSLTRAALNTAMGRDVGAPVEVRHETPPPQPSIPFEAARQTADANRPQLEALREQIRGDVAEIRARRAENKPQVGLSAAYDRPNPGGFAPQAYRYNLGLIMTFPFFDSGLTRGRVREAEGIRDENRAALEVARQQAELDVRQALLDIDEARRRIETARTEQTSAREALRVADVRYRAGVGTNVEVTDAQVALARAGQNVANAQFDYETAIARLEFATGVPIDKLLAPPATPAPAPASK